MIKNKNLICGVIIAFALVVSAIFIWNNSQIRVQERLSKPIKLPPQISGECGIENCHGLDITCGPNVPDGCTMMYAVGDNCRQFVSCHIIDGQWKLERSSKFDSCKACVEKCRLDFPDGPMKLFDCESRCAE